MIYYIRDDEGRLVGFKYNNTKYYYIKNLQDDIIGIMDSSFNTIVNYEYDSWGKVISIKDSNGSIITDTSHIGIINPYRYRSYYYDNETGYYYLNSRYYNPEWGRFINADGIINANRDIIGCNLYLYVSNKMINACDYDGTFINFKSSVLSRGVKKLVGLITTAVSSVGGFLINTPVSASMFNKSLNNPKGSINSITENKLKTKIANSKEMKEIVSNCKNDNVKSNFTCSGHTDFVSNPDLYYSIHGGDYYIVGEYKPLLNVTEISVTISDLYDFDGGSYTPWSFSNTILFFGTSLQRLEVLKPYYWEVKYTDYIFYD